MPKTRATMTSIRRARAADAVAIAAIYDPIVAETSISFEDVPPGPAEMARRIAEAADTYPWLVCERANEVVGYAYAAAHRARAAYRWSVNVSVYVSFEARRGGIGRDLYRTLFATLATQGYHAAFAGITLPNDASRALHESVGFTEVGVYRSVGFKFGEWRDTVWYERRLRPYEAEPAEPRALDRDVSVPPADVR